MYSSLSTSNNLDTKLKTNDKKSITKSQAVGGRDYETRNIKKHQIATNWATSNDLNLEAMESAHTLGGAATFFF